MSILPTCCVPCACVAHRSQKRALVTGSCELPCVLRTFLTQSSETGSLGMGEEKVVVQLSCYSVQGSQPALVPDPEWKNGWTFLQISLTSGGQLPTCEARHGSAYHKCQPFGG